MWVTKKIDEINNKYDSFLNPYKEICVKSPLGIAANILSIASFFIILLYPIYLLVNHAPPELRELHHIASNNMGSFNASIYCFIASIWLSLSTALWMIAHGTLTIIAYFLVKYAKVWSIINIGIAIYSFFRDGDSFLHLPFYCDILNLLGLNRHVTLEWICVLVLLLSLLPFKRNSINLPVD